MTLLGGCAATSHTSQQPKATPGDRFVISQDFPDPDVLASDDRYYAYATNTSSVNIQFAVSSDFHKWTVSSADALPVLPKWAQKGNTWAPDVSEPSPGRFVMYFVAREPKSGKQCIGMATATRPEGPFSSKESVPMICTLEQGGAIDPTTFTDKDGQRYLVWKNDGNCCGLDTWLQISKLTADGTALTGPTTKLIKQGQPWEGSLIEAPTLVRHGSHYVLFYSANDYSADKYAIGYASATSLLGPYTKHPSPFLSTATSRGHYAGPGGQDVVAGPGGKDYLVFHSWDPAFAFRGMNVLPLTWRGGTPVVRP
jgi:arabinan endo-1,5-alpha-L-arabinosidase